MNKCRRRIGRARRRRAKFTEQVKGAIRQYARGSDPALLPPHLRAPTIAAIRHIDRMLLSGWNALADFGRVLESDAAWLGIVTPQGGPRVEP